MKRKLYSNVIEQRKVKEEQDKKAFEAKKYYRLDNDKEVIVINDNKRTRFLKIISYKFEGLIRVITWLILMGIISVGATVLLNPTLREQFLSIFK